MRGQLGLIYWGRGGSSWIMWGHAGSSRVKWGRFSQMGSIEVKRCQLRFSGLKLVQVELVQFENSGVWRVGARLNFSFFSLFFFLLIP